MNYLLFHRYLAYISAIRKYLKGLPIRINPRDFIWTSLILFCVAAAVLWFYNHKAQKLRIEAPSAVKDTIAGIEPKPAEITKPDIKAIDLFFSTIMKGLQQENSRHKNFAPGYEQKERNEGIEQVSIYNAADKKDTADGDFHEEFLYSEDGRFRQPVDEEQVRSEVDLVNCIAKLERAEPDQIELAIRNLWIVAADLGVPDEALDALEYLVMQKHDPEVIKLAEFALADLQHLIEMRENTLAHAFTPADNSDEDQTGNLNKISASDGKKADLQSEPESPVAESSEQSAIFQAQMEELGEEALFNPNELNRRDAIQTLSNIRTESAVDVLLRAADDPEPNNRYQALQALWFSAADGLEKEDKIWLCLQQAQSDYDELVAALATKAQTDLDHLEAARMEAETAIHSNKDRAGDDHTLDLPMYDEDGSLISSD